MSTTPVQTHSNPSRTPTTSDSASEPPVGYEDPPKNYDNEDFPVLSFLFALHCDVEYSEKTYAGYEANPDDKSYLNNYVRGTRRTFPPEAIHLIHDLVPKNPKDENGHFPPTRG